MTSGVLETWVDLVETRLRLDRERRAKLTIVRWLEDNNTIDSGNDP